MLSGWVIRVALVAMLTVAAALVGALVNRPSHSAAWPAESNVASNDSAPADSQSNTTPRDEHPDSQPPPPDTSSNDSSTRSDSTWRDESTMPDDATGGAAPTKDQSETSPDMPKRAGDKGTGINPCQVGGAQHGDCPTPAQ